ncbi:hypothetical protein P8452_30211 [Trifolium repens]|nr:hypothetical protein P8452_30211 [Trifolium repens]
MATTSIKILHYTFAILCIVVVLHHRVAISINNPHYTLATSRDDRYTLISVTPPRFPCTPSEHCCINVGPEQCNIRGFFFISPSGSPFVMNRGT